MKPNLLEEVRAQLHKAVQERRLSKVSREAGIPMMTLSRIKNDLDHDPGYSKVQTLADYFWPKRRK